MAGLEFRKTSILSKICQMRYCQLLHPLTKASKLTEGSTSLQTEQMFPYSISKSNFEFVARSLASPWITKH